MDAKTKQKLMVAGGIGLIAWLVFRGKKAVDNYTTDDALADAMKILNLPGASGSGGTVTVPDSPFTYAGGGINMMVDGPRITWPAMNTLMPISIGGSQYKTGDMLLQQNYTGDFSNLQNNPLNRDCCCDDAADPVQTVSSAIIIATTKPPAGKPWEGYAWQREGYYPYGVGDARGWSM